jgi:glycosyltransferase involved in cell wall biosynthesis
MRILVCRRRRARQDEALDELVTALLQEGHEVRETRRRFAPELVIQRYAPGHAACAWFARRRGLGYCVLVDTPPRRPVPLLERVVWRTASRVLAASGALKEAIAALGVDAACIEVVPGGVVPGRFLPAPFAPARASEAVVLGWIGSGQAPAAIAAPDFSLVVIADGQVPPARVPDLLAGIDIALVAEPAPLRVLDCMAAGRAIVAPDRPETRELLEHERTALLFDAAEEGALARAAARLIADAPLRARLGEAARAELERRDVSWRSLARRLAGEAVVRQA